MEKDKLIALLAIVIVAATAFVIHQYYSRLEVDYSKSEASSINAGACYSTIVTAIDTAISTCSAEFPLCVQAAEEARVACASGYTSQCQTALQNAVTVCKSYIPPTCQSALKTAQTTCQANPKSQLCKTEVQSAAAVCKSTANQACLSAIQTAGTTITSCLQTAYPECTQALQSAKTACANGYTPECSTALQNAKTQCWSGGNLAICTDSDGGKNYYVKGTAASSKISFTDACSTSTQLQESFCDLNRYVGLMQYTCPSGYGCFDGACMETGSIPKVIISATATPTNGNAPLTVVFTVTSEATIQAGGWDFGNGSFGGCSSPCVLEPGVPISRSYTYQYPGTFTAVYKPYGATPYSTNSLIITVDPQ